MPAFYVREGEEAVARFLDRRFRDAEAEGAWVVQVTALESATVIAKILLTEAKRFYTRASLLFASLPTVPIRCVQQHLAVAALLNVLAFFRVTKAQLRQTFKIESPAYTLFIQVARHATDLTLTRKIDAIAHLLQECFDLFSCDFVND